MAAIAISIMLVNVLGILRYDDHWWDVTVALAFPASIIALITGIIAVRRRSEQSLFVYLSIMIGICTILFLLLHSLFISD